MITERDPDLITEEQYRKFVKMLEINARNIEVKIEVPEIKVEDEMISNLINYSFEEADVPGVLIKKC